jgi:hypothetical protein
MSQHNPVMTNFSFGPHYVLSGADLRAYRALTSTARQNLIALPGEAR